MSIRDQLRSIRASMTVRAWLREHFPTRPGRLAVDPGTDGETVGAKAGEVPPVDKEI